MTMKGYCRLLRTLVSPPDAFYSIPKIPFFISFLIWILLSRIILFFCLLIRLLTRKWDYFSQIFGPYCFSVDLLWRKFRMSIMFYVKTSNEQPTGSATDQVTGKVCGGARRVMVIIFENGHGEPSSILDEAVGNSRGANTLVKSIYLTRLSYEQTVHLTVLLNLDMAIGQEGKLWIQT